MAKKMKFRVKDSVMRKVAAGVAVLAVIGPTVGFINVAQINSLKTATPTIRDIQTETTLDSRAEFYATNYLWIWLTGTPDDRNTLTSFYSAIPLNDLNSDPVGVENVNVADKNLTLTAAGNRLWTYTIGATVYYPGITQPSRMFYEVSVVQKDESFSAVSLPRAVNFQRPSIEAGTAYNSSVPTTSPLYQLAVNFSTAFLTQNNSGSLGRYVTAEFSEQPQQNSPYTAADVVGVYLAGAASESLVEAGEESDVLFRVRVSTSHATYVYMDLAVTAVKQPNGQWLVNSVTTPLVGQVSTKNN